MKQYLVLLVYNLALLLVGFVDLFKWLIYLIKRLAYLVINRPMPNYEKREWLWGQKYGLVPFRLDPERLGGHSIMLHCASVGEVVAAMPLIVQLAADDKELLFVITTNTRTGKEQIKASAPDYLQHRIVHNYLPLDLPWIMAVLLRKIQPLLVVIMEVELWPNLIRQCHTRRIPIAVVNARLTDKTAKGYGKFNSVTQPMIQSLSLVFARNETDYSNYRNFNIDEDKLKLLGNIKFDIPLPDKNAAELKRQELNLSERTVLIGGSTHLGEEELLVKLYQRLKIDFPELLLLIAPRHPQRFEEVAYYLSVQELKLSQMSLEQGVYAETDVLLCDQMGKLSQLYGVADIAFVGGSVTPRGGHNPIEPSAFGKPVIMGPHVYNNPEICDTLAEQGALQYVANEEEFYVLLKDWLNSPEQGQKVGANGLDTLKQNAGIINEIAEQLGVLYKAK